MFGSTQSGSAWAEAGPSPSAAAPSTPAIVAVPAIFFRFIVVSILQPLRARLMGQRVVLRSAPSGRQDQRHDPV